jgi:hypothetical protein
MEASMRKGVSLLTAVTLHQPSHFPREDRDLQRGTSGTAIPETAEIAIIATATNLVRAGRVRELRGGVRVR